MITGDREAIVRPIAATTCDLDQLVIRGEAPFPGPFAIGHECVAEIVDLGDQAGAFKPGQRVIVSWHISCGQCTRCRAGLTAHCEEVPYGAMFGLPVAGEWGGVFSDLVRVPFASSMLVPVPDGADHRALASAGDNLALALECLAGHLGRRPSASVLILGSGSVGLYATELAGALGAGRVVYVDRDPKRRELAASLGVQAIDRPPGRKSGAFDLAIDAAMTKSGFAKRWGYSSPRAPVSVQASISRSPSPCRSSGWRSAACTSTPLAETPDRTSRSCSS